MPTVIHTHAARFSIAVSLAPSPLLRGTDSPRFILSAIPTTAHPRLLSPSSHLTTPSMTLSMSKADTPAGSRMEGNMCADARWLARTISEEQAMRARWKLMGG